MPAPRFPKALPILPVDRPTSAWALLRPALSWSALTFRNSVAVPRSGIYPLRSVALQQQWLNCLTFTGKALNVIAAVRAGQNPI